MDGAPMMVFARGCSCIVFFLGSTRAGLGGNELCAPRCGAQLPSCNQLSLTVGPTPGCGITAVPWQSQSWLLRSKVTCTKLLLRGN